ncbi:fatty acyl-CoA reductase wat-like [Vespa crabro]|uniref:fatty acyl-CoA reductase wat-like n=1 Tax=Vespa crabro TaxID=7445 RepID=UPI001F02AE45|nr:fatty acyl-CoA reductase wat-like [Vespa crabro]XP_046837371.1 fatty acyl-CoA reductase wat-like [Vespa crabro]XP_046837372.1 fatty acyl-CoA reductase wat-like [Vespa crabro]
MMKPLLEESDQEVALDSTVGTSTIESSVEIIDKLTPIQKFYDDESVFLTGGTGFMGKLLIEKLLRGCPGIRCIYILIRSKKGKNVLERLDELMEDSLFSKLRKEETKFRKRIVAIKGDCSLPNLGISKIDRATLIREVSIVFNVAATVRFNEAMKAAIAINVRSLRDLIKLSKEMPNLKSFVHVSTAYANCLYNQIEEKIYDPPIDADKLIDLIDLMEEKLLNDITPHLLGRWPNSYVYTKSLAENVVKKHADTIPIGIFRPGIVISTYREPVQGWVDNMYGPIGITANILMGIMRIHHCDASMKVNLVPGDLTINGLIASAWGIANNLRSNEGIPIYNYVSQDNPITYDRLKEMTLKYERLIPSKEIFWYCSFKMTKYRLIYLIYVYFLHLLPAFIIDAIALCVGKQPRLLGMYKKIHQMSDVFGYFCTNEWTYTNERWNELMKKLTPADRDLFLCDMNDIVWDIYFATYVVGIRKYILKDPIETLPQARIKWRRLYWAHQGFKLSIACIFFVIIWGILLSVPRLFLTLPSS